MESSLSLFPFGRWSHGCFCQVSAAPDTATPLSEEHWCCRERYLVLLKSGFLLELANTYVKIDWKKKNSCACPTNSFVWGLNSLKRGNMMDSAGNSSCSSSSLGHGDQETPPYFLSVWLAPSVLFLMVQLLNAVIPLGPMTLAVVTAGCPLSIFLMLS